MPHWGTSHCFLSLRFPSWILGVLLLVRGREGKRSKGKGWDLGVINGRKGRKRGGEGKESTGWAKNVHT